MFDLKKDYVIWGTGAAWQSFKASFPEIKVKYFIDNNERKQGTQIDGVPVLAPMDFSEYDLTLIIVSEFYQDIRYQINQLYANRLDVRLYDDILVDNIDNLIISFPKCGRTWMRTIIGRILQVRFDLPESKIFYLTDGPIPLKDKLPVILASHDQQPHQNPADTLVFNPEKYKRKNVLFMMRQPHDVIVSLFYHLKYRAGMDIDNRIDFIKTKTESYVTFCNLWYGNRSVMNEFEIVTYEQMHQNCFDTVQRTISVLFPDQLKVSEQEIEDAIAYSQLSNMKKLEKSDQITHHTLNSKSEDQRAMKVRKGKVGGFKNELSKQEIEVIDEIVNKELDPKLHQLLYNA